MFRPFPVSEVTPNLQHGEQTTQGGGRETGEAPLDGPGITQGEKPKR